MFKPIKVVPSPQIYLLSDFVKAGCVTFEAMPFFSNEVRSEPSLSPFYDVSVSVSLTECYVYCTMCNIMLAVVIGNILIV